MKKLLIVISYVLLFVVSAYGQEKDLVIIEEALKSKIDSSWTISTDTSAIRKDAFDRATLLGVVRLRTNKGDKLDLLLCKSSSEYLFKKSVVNHQLSASCSLSEDYDTHRSILKIENYYLFLPMYPCWSVYTKDSQLLMKKLVEKTEHY